MINRRYISTDFWVALYNNDFDKNLLRTLAKQIPTTIIFEDCAKRKISSSDAANIMMFQREPENWFLRWIYNNFNI